MSLHLIIGPSGSGKTHTLFNFALEEANKHPELNYLVIVPEQFTLSTQKQLVKLSDKHGILNVDVLSFARLSYRIFEEVGFQETSGVIMDDMGKNLVLRHLASINEDKLTYLTGNMNKLGYITEVKSLISEFKQYKIADAEIERMISTAGEAGKGLLSRKLSDVKIIYDSFNEYVKDKYTTTEEILDLAARSVYKSDKLKKSVVLFDGFTGFTPVQYGLIESLLNTSCDIYMTLLSDARDGQVYNTEHELFYLSHETEKKLKVLCEKNNVTIANDVVLNNIVPARLGTDKKRLIHLEKNLFREYKTPYICAIDYTGDMKLPTKTVNEEIRVFSALNPIEEVRKMASSIKKLVIDKGYRYKDIAIVVGDMESYTSVILREFSKYDIPVFTDKNNPVLMNPFCEFIRSIIELITTDCSYEAVFRYLRSELSGYKTCDIDVLENFVLAKGIKGYKTWQLDWIQKYNCNSKKIEKNLKFDLNNIENIRAEIAEDFKNIYNLITACDENDKKIQTKSVNELNIGFYRVLEHKDIYNKLMELSNRYIESDVIFEKNRSNEFLKVYSETIHLMEKMNKLLGDELVTISEYGQLLDAGFDEIRIGIIPNVIDYVQIGDVTRSRFSDIHALFIVGANDGLIPQNNSNGGIISDIEKEFLIEYTGDIELSPSARMKAYTNQLYMYMLMTKPDSNLYISYSRLNGASESLKPSYIVKTILDLFPDIKIERDDSSIYDYIYNEETGFESLSSHFMDSEDTYSLMSYLYNHSSDTSGRTRIEKMAEAYLTSGVLKGTDAVSKAVSNVLYGNALKGSVTRLERFAECAYRYFLEYGLDVKERELFDFKAQDFGVLYHDALEKYSNIVANNGDSWTDIDPDKREEYMDEAIEGALRSLEESAIYSTFRKKYMINRVRRILKRSINVLTEHLKAGKFVPIDAEVEFSSLSNLKAFNLMLSDTERMHLSGKIDRIDSFEDEEHLFIKIIDYKSGNKSFDLMEIYKGLSLQLVVYLNAAMEMVSEKTDKQVIPAGILYYHVDDPMVDSDVKESDLEIAEKIYSKLKMKGLVNSDESVYRLIDEEFQGSSNIIPVKLTTKKELAATSTVASTEEFEVISSYVNKKLVDGGKAILDGVIKAEPHSAKGIDEKKCSYCPYTTVCKFNSANNDYDEEAVTSKLKKEEIILLMKQELS